MTSYQPHSLLVTGGAGFIGANFICHLLTTDPVVRVVNLDLLTYAGSLDNLRRLGVVANSAVAPCARTTEHDPPAMISAPGRYDFVHGDICDRPLVDRLLKERQVDTIVHFAAESHVDRSIASPAPFIRTNLMGTFTLLDAARCYWLNERGLNGTSCRFHHISTDEVYGTLGRHDPRFTERAPYAPSSPYSASKAGADHIVQSYFHTFGLPVVMTNCSNNYGPLQHREKFVPTIIASCLEQRPIPVYGDGSNIRDWLYVEDHCRAVDLVMRGGRIGERYHIGGANERANIDTVRHVCTIMDAHCPRVAPHERLIAFVTDRPGHDWRYAIDSGKIRKELGWHPCETVASGMRKTVAWYCEQSGMMPVAPRHRDGREL